MLMLIILNPFAQVLYLRQLIDDLPFRVFAPIHLRASLYSFIIFAIFALCGEPILYDLFQIRLGSLRVFGGMINLYVAYRYIAVGEGSTLLFRGNVADLAPNITLPYMVGPGMLWVSILMGETYGVPMASAMIAGVLAVNVAFVFAAHVLFRRSDDNRETAFTKYFAVLMRACVTEAVVEGVTRATFALLRAL